MPGLLSGQVEVCPTSPYAGESLGRRLRSVCSQGRRSAREASLPFRPPVSFVETSAAIGVVLLLLTLGLQFPLTEFTVSRRRHVPSAVVDLVLKAVPGAVSGWHLGLDGVGIVALAGTTYVSSSGMVARLLASLRRLGNREAQASSPYW
ncbi:cation:proton antiporter [Streptomyces flavidovirens]|uniref:Cation:proton antiporter n=1 Tax=Streptomyces flavidovirens TaxID=67298 RepID=A0ABW6RNL0_9ACTN